MPRIALGRVLREKRISAAMIDVSDGLSTDLSHICEESGVGAQITELAVPRAKAGKPPGTVAINFALHGGDDYELLFTARPRTQVPRSIAGVPLTEIGQITRRKEMFLIHKDGRRSCCAPRMAAFREFIQPAQALVTWVPGYLPRLYSLCTAKVRVVPCIFVCSDPSSFDASQLRKIKLLLLRR